MDKLIDNSIHRKPINIGDTLICEEHNEKLSVFERNDRLYIWFSFDSNPTLLTEKIIKANNLLRKSR